MVLATAGGSCAGLAGQPFEGTTGLDRPEVGSQAYGSLQPGGTKSRMRRQVIQG